ncbi:MAG: type-F conjugative transfer system secretin TraK [Proteobacteria bacterium]|nr:type-F conjugative transfer system secretin TraK [Pseudomonadota bacterium]
MKFNNSLTILASAMLSFSAFAMQEIPVTPGQSIEISVSKKEFTMIGVDGGKVAYIDGQDGAYITDADTDAGRKKAKEIGRVMIQPLTDKPFSIFVTDDTGVTWPIKVKPNAKLSGDVIVLKNTERVIVEKNNDMPIMSRATSRTQSIKNLMIAMSTNATPRDVSVVRVDKKVRWWKESELVNTRDYVLGDLRGKLYELTNISDKPMVIDDREFYITQNIIAVAVEDAKIQPGEKTKVMVIMQGEGE